MNLKLFTFLLAFSFEVSSSKYEIIFDKVETAFGDDDKVFVFEKLRVKKYNRTTYVIDGKYRLIEEIGNDHVAHVSLLNMQGGQYKLIVNKEFDSICTRGYQEQFKKLHSEFQAHQDIQVPWKACPYPTGTYELRNYLIEDYGDILPPYLPGSEKWQMQIRYSLNGEMLGGFNLYATLRSERSLLEG